MRETLDVLRTYVAFDLEQLRPDGPLGERLSKLLAVVDVKLAVEGLWIARPPAELRGRIGDLLADGLEAAYAMGRLLAEPRPLPAWGARASPDGRPTLGRRPSPRLPQLPYAPSVIKGAFAAALTPLRDGGAALDEAAFDAVRRRSSPRAASTGSSRSARPARGSCSRRPSGAAPPSCSSPPPGASCRSRSTAAPRRPPRPPRSQRTRPRPAPTAVAVIAPPYFPLDEAALVEHFAAAAAACAPLPFYVYEFAGPQRLRRPGRA